MNYRSADKTGPKKEKQFINWERLLKVSPAVFLISFFILFGVLLGWAQINYDWFSLVVELFS